MSEDELIAVRDTIDQYFACGWIGPSTGSYSIPIIVIRKKTGELCVFIDYRLLNKQTRLDSYPIPRIDELFNHHAHVKYFNKIDLASGYHQIKMADGHKDKTAFFTRYGTYEWLVLPLGLTNAPTTFQRLMNGFIHDFLDKMLLVYLDDLLVYSDTDVQYLEDINNLLYHLCDNKLKAKMQKCDFNAQQVEYLGHIVSNGKVAMDPSKISAVKEWPLPMNMKQLQLFLGFCNYYNRFINNYSWIIAPLTKLLQKDVEYTWGDYQYASFKELVHVLTLAPILQMPQFAKLFTVHVDTSDVAIGSVLTQMVDDMDMLVCYYNKRLNETEARWSIYECELYAIVQALGKWQCYLVNRHTVVYSNHQPLQYFISQPKLSAKWQRWLDFLADFSINVQYQPGKHNIFPNALSRQPAPPTDVCPCSDACLSSMVLEPSWLAKVY